MPHNIRERVTILCSQLISGNCCYAKVFIANSGNARIFIAYPTMSNISYRQLKACELCFNECPVCLIIEMVVLHTIWKIGSVEKCLDYI